MLTFEWLSFVPASVWAAFASLVAYASFLRILRFRRPRLVLATKQGVGSALNAVVKFSTDLYVPDDIRAEFERRRMRLQDTLETVLDQALRATSTYWRNDFSFLREERRLRASLEDVVEPFAQISLAAFRKESYMQLHEWAVQTHRQAEEQYVLAEAYALRLPQEPTCQLIMTALVPMSAQLKEAVQRVTVLPEDAVPQSEDIRALDVLAQEICRLSKLVCDVPHTTDIPRSVDSPVGQPRWMLQ